MNLKIKHQFEIGEYFEKLTALDIYCNLTFSVNNTALFKSGVELLHFSTVMFDMLDQFAGSRKAGSSSYYHTNFKIEQTKKPFEIRFWVGNENKKERSAILDKSCFFSNLLDFLENSFRYLEKTVPDENYNVTFSHIKTLRKALA